MKGPSEHLTWKELACKDGTPYPDKWRKDRAVRLAKVFEMIRAIWNKPIVVLSAYRTPSHNRKIGGARFSQHMEGRALDLRPPAGVSITQFYEAIRTVAHISDINGIGRYRTFVHVDIRPSDKLIVWHGSGIKDSGINV